MSHTLEQVVIEPTSTAQYAVIWLHGLGADGHDFAPIVPQLQLAQDNIRFIFPHAPVIPVTINFGMSMRAWFDIVELDRRKGIDMDGASESSAAVQAIIAEQEKQGIASENIILGGFSQGGAVALYTGLTYPKKLAGIFGLSTFLPHPEAYEVIPHDANQQTPILMCHGAQDPLIPLSYATSSVTDLKNMGYDVEWHEYPMEHAVCPQEIVDISQFLQRVIA